MAITVEVDVANQDSYIYDLTNKSKFVLENLTLIRSKIRINYANSMIIRGCHFIRSSQLEIILLKTIDLIDNKFTEQFTYNRMVFIVYEFSKIQNNTFYNNQGIELIVVGKKITKYKK